MSSLTHAIEIYINDLLNEAASESMLSIRRKELAQTFGCVPSQINYVLSSRFTQEQGYIVESQRGGHGYIRIEKIKQNTTEDKLNHLEKAVGETISWQDVRKNLSILQKREIITTRERLLIEVALRHCDELGESLFGISSHKREGIQAELLKRMLRSIVLA
ncbi:MAG: CtsR family transcriptional regulator [Synergistaceae bacterium]|nr:CtsR family transcriptional regulator [Synergistaceae bacterium]